MKPPLIRMDWDSTRRRKNLSIVAVQMPCYNVPQLRYHVVALHRISRMPLPLLTYGRLCHAGEQRERKSLILVAQRCVNSGGGFSIRVVSSG